MFEVLFQYGSVTVRTFNIFLALAFFFSGGFFLRFVNRRKMNLAFFSRYFLFFPLGMIIGGRVFYILEHFSVFKNTPLNAFLIWDLRFSFFGILYSILILFFLFARRAKEDFWGWFDASSLSLLLAMFMVHIGHFFNGTQYGSLTTLPWGIAFDTQNIPFFHPIHPTQIYAALISIIIFFYSLKKSRRVHLSGIIGSMALMLYSIAMFGIDFLHGTPSLYVKISFGIIAVFSFISLVHCSHKSYNDQ